MINSVEDICAVKDEMIDLAMEREVAVVHESRGDEKAMTEISICGSKVIWAGSLAVFRNCRHWRPRIPTRCVVRIARSRSSGLESIRVSLDPLS